jgi:hypothetical protein
MVRPTKANRPAAIAKAMRTRIRLMVVLFGGSICLPTILFRCARFGNRGQPRS